MVTTVHVYIFLSLEVVACMYFSKLEVVACTMYICIFLSLEVVACMSKSRGCYITYVGVHTNQAVFVSVFVNVRCKFGH